VEQGTEVQDGPADQAEEVRLQGGVGGEITERDGGDTGGAEGGENGGARASEGGESDDRGSEAVALHETPCQLSQREEARRRGLQAARRAAEARQQRLRLH
jgi:hypothetical protein